MSFSYLMVPLTYSYTSTTVTNFSRKKTYILYIPVGKQEIRWKCPRWNASSLMLHWHWWNINRFVRWHEPSTTLESKPGCVASHGYQLRHGACAWYWNSCLTAETDSVEQNHSVLVLDVWDKISCKCGIHTRKPKRLFDVGLSLRPYKRRKWDSR